MKNWHQRRPFRAALAFALTFLIAPAVTAATLTVTDCGDTTPGGVPGQLRRLISDSAPGDTIVVPACTITLTGAAGDDANATGDLDMLKDLTIQGAGAGLTVIDGGAIDRVFHVSGAVGVAISGLTLRNGRSSGSGAGILNSGTLTIGNSALSGNAAVGSGGGVFNDGSLTISNSAFATNSARYGGGIWNAGALQISDSTFAGNFTGGIAPAAGVGGALANSGGSAAITASTLSANSGASGGGIGNISGGTLTITNSTVSGNQAIDSGGGISSFSSSLTVTASTITANRADSNNDGTGNGGGFIISGGSALFHGTIVAANLTMARSDGLGTVQASSSFNVIGVDTGLSGIGDGVNGNQVGAAATPLDPVLGPLQDNGGATSTHEPLSGSPAIDAGQNAGCPLTDQRGQARPTDGDGDGLAVCDVGAVEIISVSVNDVSLVEGNAGTSNAVFTVSLSAPVSHPVTVNYATADGTVGSGDYVPAAGQLSFAPGDTTRTIAVAVAGDVLDEPDETFFVNLSGASGAVIADGQGTGTILDDDPAAELSIDDVAVLEGDAGSTPATFTVTTAPSAQTITVAYQTATGTAGAGDFTAASGALTFPPGTTSRTIDVLVTGDVAVELDETFTVDLSAATGAPILDGQAIGTILDDDATSLSGVELSHGSHEVYTLEPPPPGTTPDVDFFRLAQKPRSSWEVVVDATSGDTGPLSLDRLASDNATVLQSGSALGPGGPRALRWLNPHSTAVVSQHIRVASGGCGTACGADDEYRIRAYETTGSIPRFNNAGTQVSVLILQNPSDVTVAGTAYFWDSAGSLLSLRTFSMGPKATLVLNLSSVSGLPGKSGTITVAHDGGYGGLAGKAVALEPATGFSFDSPLLSRPR